MEVVENERDLLEQDNIALRECFAWLQRCECIERFEERSRASVLGCRLEIDNLWWPGSRDSRVQRFDCRNVLYILAVIIRILAAARETRRDSFGERSIFENRILTGAVINADYIELRQFLEDAGCVVLERLRNVIERHNGIKVNTVFNGEFVAGDKHSNKSINTRNYELF